MEVAPERLAARRPARASPPIQCGTAGPRLTSRQSHQVCPITSATMNTTKRAIKSPRLTRRCKGNSTARRRGTRENRISLFMNDLWAQAESMRKRLFETFHISEHSLSLFEGD